MDFILSIDSTVLNFLISHRTDFFNSVFQFVTSLGDGGFIWIIIGIVMLAFKKTRKTGFVLLIALGLTALLNNLVLKVIFDRARPYIADPAIQTIIDFPGGASFPSGHSSSSFAAAAVLMKYRRKLGIPAICLAFLIALSRIYFGVHYLSDVLAGAAEGIIMALIVCAVFDVLYKKIRKNHFYKISERKTVYEGFSYEPIPDKIKKLIDGVSLPSDAKVSPDDLFYLNVLYKSFDGSTEVGELICSRFVGKELCRIFKKLYDKNYRIEKIRLIDNYDADDEKSMSDNNSSCFCYRNIADTNTLSLHSYGLAVDINPLYNPYIANGKVMPANASEYTIRTREFPHKIDRGDQCYKTFKHFGWRWGGEWEMSKDYQHFYKEV